MGGNEIIAKERAPKKPKAEKPEVDLTTETDEAPAPAPKAPKVKAEAPEVETYELLYLGNKNPKTVEIEHENGRVHTVTFTKPTPKLPGVATIECEDCYVHLMNIAGPSPEVPEDHVIFMPPAQLKPWQAMKSRRDAAREKALAELKQPWKDEQAKRAQQGE